jgi:hypothetical protein
MTDEEKAVAAAERAAAGEKKAAKAKAMTRGFGTYKKSVSRKGTGRGRGGRKGTGSRKANEDADGIVEEKVQLKARKISIRNMLL